MRIPANALALLLSIWLAEPAIAAWNTETWVNENGSKRLKTSAYSDDARLQISCGEKQDGKLHLLLKVKKFYGPVPVSGKPVHVVLRLIPTDGADLEVRSEVRFDKAESTYAGQFPVSDRFLSYFARARVLRILGPDRIYIAEFIMGGSENAAVEIFRICKDGD